MATLNFNIRTFNIRNLNLQNFTRRIFSALASALGPAARVLALTGVTLVNAGETQPNGEASAAGDFVSLTNLESKGTAMPATAAVTMTDYAQFSAARRFVETDYGRIAVVEHGTGPAAVYLHGFPLNGYHWRHQLTALADIRRGITIDLMGLGHTEIDPDQDLSFSAQARMVLATLDALGVDEFDLVGNDTGGGVAQLIVAMAPARVRSLVLTNADIHNNWPPKSLDTIHRLATEGVLDQVFMQYLDDVELVRKGLGATAFEDPAHITAELNAIYLGPVTATADRRAQVNRFIASQNNAETVAIEADLKRFQAPTLVLWGTGDVFFGIEWAYWLQDTIPGVTQVIELPDAKLFFAEERHETVSAHLRAHWLSGTKK